MAWSFNRINLDSVNALPQPELDATEHEHSVDTAAQKLKNSILKVESPLLPKIETSDRKKHSPPDALGSC